MCSTLFANEMRNYFARSWQPNDPAPDGPGQVDVLDAAADRSEAGFDPVCRRVRNRLTSLHGSPVVPTNTVAVIAE